MMRLSTTTKWLLALTVLLVLESSVGVLAACVPYCGSTKSIGDIIKFDDVLTPTPSSTAYIRTYPNTITLTAWAYDIDACGDPTSVYDKYLRFIWWGTDISETITNSTTEQVERNGSLLDLEKGEITLSWETEGTKNIYLKVDDRLYPYYCSNDIDTSQQNPSVVKEFTVIVDNTPPTVPTVTDDGEWTASSSQLHATWSATDSLSGIAEYQYAIGTSPTDPGSGYVVGWTSTGTNASVTHTGLSLTEGITYYFYVKAKDRVDLWSNVGVSDGITVDLTDPWGNIIIDNDAQYAYTEAVTLTLSATDTGSGVYQMQFSNDETNWSEWEAYATSKAWTLTPIEGNEIVYVKFKDNAGNVSDVDSDTIEAKVGALMFSPTGEDEHHYLCTEVEISWADTETPGATIRYTVDGTTPMSDDSNPSTRTYDPNGRVAIDRTQSPQTLKARAFKTGFTDGDLYLDEYSIGSMGNYYTCYVDHYVWDPTPPVEYLRVTDIFMRDVYLPDDSPSETMRLEWVNSIYSSTGSFNVKRKLATDNTPWADVPTLGTASGCYFVDETGFDFGTPLEYAVIPLTWDEPIPEGLFPCNHEPDDPDCHPKQRIHWRSIGTTYESIDVTPVAVVASANQTVDSRLDTRYIEDKLVDFKFKSKVYRGGLFAGFADTPDNSRVARSFLKFDLQPPEGQLWAASANAFYTRSFIKDIETEVGCQHIADDSWDTDELTWSSAPSFTPSAAIDTVALNWTSAHEEHPEHWCAWNKQFTTIAEEMYSPNHLLSLGLASTNESQSNSWAYFAKKEFSENLGPRILYAYDDETPYFATEVRLSSDTVIGGNTVTATVVLNAPAPAGGLDVSVYTGEWCDAAVTPSTIHVDEGGIEVGLFTISTPFIPISGDNKETTIIARVFGTNFTFLARATLTITP